MLTRARRCISVNFPIPQSFSFPKSRQYSRGSRTATTKLHVIRGRLIMRKNPFGPAAIRFCVIDSGSSQRKNTFLQRCKTTSIHNNHKVLDQQQRWRWRQKRRGGCSFTSSPKPETQSRNFRLVENKSQTNSIIVGSERSF